MSFMPLLTDEPLSWSGFVEALVVMSGWAFFAGAFFNWLPPATRFLTGPGSLNPGTRSSHRP